MCRFLFFYDIVHGNTHATISAGTPYSIHSTTQRIHTVWRRSE